MARPPCSLGTHPLNRMRVRVMPPEKLTGNRRASLHRHNKKSVVTWGQFGA
jgi:hypothetical protein